MNNLKEESSKAFIWDFSGKLSTHIVSFIISVILARILEPHDFGLIAIIMVVFGIAGLFGDAGLGSALIQRKKILPIHLTSVFYFNICVGLSLTIFIFLSANLISQFYNNNELIILIKVLSFSFLIHSFGTVHGIILRRNLNFKTIAIVNFISSFLSGIIGVVAAFNGKGIWSIVLQQLSQAIIYNILLWIVNKWKPSFNFSMKALRVLWIFGFRMFLVSLLDAIYTRLDFIIIGKLFTPTILGYYQRAKSTEFIMLYYTSSSFVSVLFPLLSKLQHDILKFKTVILKFYSFVIFMIFLLIGIMYIVSDELIVLLFTEKWIGSIIYFKLMIFSAFSIPISSLLNNILSSRGKSKLLLKLELYKKILLSINLIFGFMLGIEGYLYGLIIVSFLSVYMTISYTGKELTITKRTFLVPFINQIIITIFTVFIIGYLVSFLNFSLFFLFITKIILYLFIYTIISKLLKLNSYINFVDILKYIIKKVIKI